MIKTIYKTFFLINTIFIINSITYEMPIIESIGRLCVALAFAFMIFVEKEDLEKLVGLIKGNNEK